MESCAGQNDDNFPSSLDGYTKTVNWLKTQFGLKDDREAIVLLGAHTTGNAERENSGHRGILMCSYFAVELVNVTKEEKNDGLYVDRAVVCVGVSRGYTDHH